MFGLVVCVGCFTGWLIWLTRLLFVLLMIAVSVYVLLWCFLCVEFVVSIWCLTLFVVACLSATCLFWLWVWCCVFDCCCSSFFTLVCNVDCGVACWVNCFTFVCGCCFAVVVFGLIFVFSFDFVVLIVLL